MLDGSWTRPPSPPLPLQHSWSLYERETRFDLGELAPEGNGTSDFDSALLFGRGLGAWDCELASGALIWSAKVHDLFGMPRDATPTRAQALACYAEHSRVILERLRTYAIQHRRGFTLDAELRPATGGTRWMRLIASPVCEGNRVVRLCGIKRDITAAYCRGVPA